jgi:pyridinium-3,5-biscarboxylic acid mononucleotide sulfurtransferase
MINPEKYDMLLRWLGRFQNAVIAFSGGVDSTFVLSSAQKVLGEKVMAYTVKTPYIPEWELDEATVYCRNNKIRHRIVRIGILPEIMQNPENRCYLCKKYLFSLLKEEAQKDGFEVVFDGTNFDDTGVHRPGLAALQELGIRSPLLENGITKAEVRHFSRKLGLPTADKPSYACLLTRLPYNSQVKTEELARIEKAERFLAFKGFSASRVRNHGTIARIELEKDRIPEFINSPAAKEIIEYFHTLGYQYITVDLDGYRSGSFDINLTQSTI